MKIDIGAKKSEAAIKRWRNGSVDKVLAVQT